MISIDFDKLEYVCKILVGFQDMLSDNLKRTRRASDDIRFTPIEMVSCPSVGRLEDDMRNTQRKGEKILDDIEDLLRFIRYAMDRYKDADSRIAREIAASNLIIANATVNNFVDERNHSVWDNVVKGLTDFKVAFVNSADYFKDETDEMKETQQVQNNVYSGETSPESIRKNLNAGKMNFEAGLINGILQPIAHPIKTVVGISKFVNHDPEVMRGMANEIDSFNKADTNTKILQGSEFSWNIASVVAPFAIKNVGALARTARISDLEKVDDIAQINNFEARAFQSSKIPEIGELNKVNEEARNIEIAKVVNNPCVKLSGKEVELKWLSNNYKAVEIEGTVKVNGEIRDISRRVYQTNIDWDFIPKDANVNGLTNRELALKGRSAYAIDKNGFEAKIELHHLTQIEAGSMVEIVATTHDEYTKILHGLVESGGSFRNNVILDKQYSNFLKKYWRWRAKNM